MELLEEQQVTQFQALIQRRGNCLVPHYDTAHSALRLFYPDFDTNEICNNSRRPRLSPPTNPHSPALNFISHSGGCPLALKVPT